MNHKDRIVISGVVTDSRWLEKTLKAVLHSKRVSGINDAQIVSTHDFFHSEIRCIRLNEDLSNLNDPWNYFMSKLYNNYINNEFLLNIHDDGFVINPDRWSDEFLEFDYIGALWGPENPIRCGNGGFSLRSKKLMEIQQNQCDFIPNSYAEDYGICAINRSIFLKNGIKYAPNDIASKFSIENEFMPEYVGQTHTDRFSLKTFGFHHGYSDALNYLNNITL
jgi:hypothetical protein